MSSEVRFTRAQKWDLVRISAAAVASTVFFTVPMFLIGPHPAARVETAAAAPAQTLTAVRPSELPVNAVNAGEPPTGAAMPTDENAVSVVTSTEFAAATMPSLQQSTMARSRMTRPAAQLRARANTVTTTPSLTRRVARFLTGSGKYNVKPFPTINSSGS